MKILLVGNKPTNISLDINEYDMIVQINRMNNICNIPKVDLWYCDCHHEFFELNNEILDSNVDLNSTKVIIPHKEQHNILKLCRTFPGLKFANVSIHNLNTFMRTDVINGKHKTKNMLTSDVIVLIYLLEQYPDAEITLTCLDVYNRGEILSNQKSHKRTFHENAVFDEEEYLIQLIKDDKIKFIETELIKKNES